jgi:hypothetical protein
MEPAPVAVSLGAGALDGGSAGEGSDGSEGEASSDVVDAGPTEVVADAAGPGSLPRKRKNRPAPTAARTTTAATTSAIIVFLLLFGGCPPGPPGGPQGWPYGGCPYGG